MSSESVRIGSCDDMQLRFQARIDWVRCRILITLATITTPNHKWLAAQYIRWPQYVFDMFSVFFKDVFNMLCSIPRPVIVKISQPVCTKILYNHQKIKTECWKIVWNPPKLHIPNYDNPFESLNIRHEKIITILRIPAQVFTCPLFQK